MCRTLAPEEYIKVAPWCIIGCHNHTVSKNNVIIEENKNYDLIVYIDEHITGVEHTLTNFDIKLSIAIVNFRNNY